VICLKTEKSASNISLALLMDTETPSQSPAGESVVELTLFDCKNPLTGPPRFEPALRIVTANKYTTVYLFLGKMFPGVCAAGG
jgi:hypothetical protein